MPPGVAVVAPSVLVIARSARRVIVSCRSLCCSPVSDRLRRAGSVDGRRVRHRTDADAATVASSVYVTRTTDGESSRCPQSDRSRGDTAARTDRRRRRSTRRRSGQAGGRVGHGRADDRRRTRVRRHDRVRDRRAGHRRHRTIGLGDRQISRGRQRIRHHSPRCPTRRSRSPRRAPTPSHCSSTSPSPRIDRARHRERRRPTHRKVDRRRDVTRTRRINTARATGRHTRPRDRTKIGRHRVVDDRTHHVRRAVVAHHDRVRDRRTRHRIRRPMRSSRSSDQPPA